VLRNRLKGGEIDYVEKTDVSLERFGDCAGSELPDAAVSGSGESHLLQLLLHNEK
jgi:hypothetical protein